MSRLRIGLIVGTCFSHWQYRASHSRHSSNCRKGHGSASAVLGRCDVVTMKKRIFREMTQAGGNYLASQLTLDVYRVVARLPGFGQWKGRLDSAVEPRSPSTWRWQLGGLRKPSPVIGESTALDTTSRQSRGQHRGRGVPRPRDNTQLLCESFSLLPGVVSRPRIKW